MLKLFDVFGFDEVFKVVYYKKYGFNVYCIKSMFL